MGAAVQAGIIAGEITDLILLDVTPLSLGVETMGGLMTTIINRNASIPVKQSEVFSTGSDSQDTVEIHVLQGERSFAKDNKSLGTSRLDGILPAPRGVPQIEVTFDIDANGILSVTAKDKGTTKQQSITISGASTLPKDEVEKMVKEAEINAAADKEKAENVRSKNEADSACYQAEKQLKELPEELKTANTTLIAEINQLIEKLKTNINAEEFSQIKENSQQLQQKMMEIGQKAYANNQPQGGGGNQTATKQQADDDIIDAEFSETK
jgi:molecular chaperone DnaK